MPSDYEARLDRYLAMRYNHGWTCLSFNSPIELIRKWLKEHIGPELDSSNWKENTRGGTWEQWGDGTVLIRDPEQAMLFKLTWGGQ